MPKMSNVFRITFTRNPLPNEPFYWQTTEPVEITAMHQDTAEKMARRSLGLDARDDADRWIVKECENLGPWNRVYQ